MTEQSAPSAASRKGPTVKKGSAKGLSGPKGNAPKGDSSRLQLPAVSGPQSSPSRPASLTRRSTGSSSPMPRGPLPHSSAGSGRSRDGVRARPAPSPLACVMRSEHPTPAQVESGGSAVVHSPLPLLGCWGHSPPLLGLARAFHAWMTPQTGTSRVHRANRRGPQKNANHGRSLQGLPLANLAAPRRDMAFLPKIL